MAMYNEITVTAELTNTEYMITKNYNLLENKPQINSVELIGNKSLEDLGINPDAEENVIDVVKVNGSALTPDANKAVNVTVTTGSDNGTVKVNGSDVAVKGLKSAAFTEATAYDAAGSAAEVQGNVDALTVVVNGKVDKVQGKGLSQNDFTNAYKSKLDGIEAGAQVNTVTSVAGKTGAVTLQKSDVGLGNVDNTSDLNKPISTATQTALNAKADTSAVNTALAGKVDKVAGKGLSTEDFTTAEKTKLAGIEAEANKTVVDSAISSSSTNPVQNKAIYDLINNLLPEKTATGNPISISDASGFNAKSAKVTMLPIQDLHGYDHPWVGGNGKNKLNFMRTSSTIQGITFDIDTNGVVTANGTSTSVAVFSKDVDLIFDTDCYLSGSPNVQGCQIDVNGGLYPDSGNGSTIPSNTQITSVRIRIGSGVTVNNVKFYPMIRTSGDASFAPYSNICPISGFSALNVTRTGVNLLKYPFASTTNTTRGITFIDNGDGTITVNGTATANADYTLYSLNGFTLPQGQYVLSVENMPAGCYVVFGSTAIPYVNVFGSVLPYTFTISNDKPIGYGILRIPSGTTVNNLVFKPMIRVSGTSADFEPYNRQTHTATFPDTVYGGSYDFVSGEGNSTMALVDLGTLNWVKGNINTAGTGRIFYVPLTASSPMKQPSDNAFCEALTYNPFSNWPAGQWERQILNGITVTGSSALVACVPDIYATASDFKTAMDGVQLCYELATPIEITLTDEQIALLKGNNTLWTDGDNAEVKYSVSLDSLLPT